MIKVEGLSKEYSTGIIRKKHKTVLSDVNFTLEAGEVLGIVGESGSGKSTLGRLIAGIECPTKGTILFNGESYREILTKNRIGFCKQVQMVFQNPTMAFNPKKTLRFSLLEPYNLHKMKSGIAEDDFLSDCLEHVSLEMELLDRYPHELSGGQLQRFALARIFSLKPSLIIADEPTSMLDVCVTANVINYLMKYKKDHHAAILFISHDLELISQISDKMMVFQDGKVKEQGYTYNVMNNPNSDYTKELIENIVIEI